jgi:two-component system, chemotaxis family, chemotaxis protein CheY
MSLNVLIVDDSSVMRSIVKKVLTVSGFELGSIYEAGDGVQALAALEQNWIDVILTDINMPNMNGYEFMRAVKASDSFAGIPVIVISTEVRDEKIEEMLSMGATGYITKPFKPEDIRRIFSDVLGVDAHESSSQGSEDSDF